MIKPPMSAGVSLLSAPPMRGTPYLASENFAAGAVYYPLTKRTSRIGRDADNDLIIDTSFEEWQTVSRHHAVVEQDAGRVLVMDCGSQNGVYVGVPGAGTGLQRTGTNLLHDGWRVAFGKVRFIYRENQ